MTDPDTRPPAEPRPHGDPLVPHEKDRPERSPSDLPAPEPVDGPGREGDDDPGAGAD
jgi:hypothetical protein